MELFRLHAYAVVPHRTSPTEDEPDPVGGAVQVSRDLRVAIDGNIQGARFHERIGVDFQMDQTTRRSDVRELIMNFAFGEAPTAKAAGQSLARRLANAMDRRSMQCLFIPAVMRQRGRRRVTLWTFPQDRAFQFRNADTGPTIEVMTDVFSQSSKLRKAALFEGGRSRSDFLRGQVLDFQASHSSRDVADFWIERFLACNLGIRADTGTRLLAKTARSVYERSETADDRETLHAAMMSMRRSPQKRVSLQTFAVRYLEGELRERFLNAAPNDHSRDSLFDFRRDVFDETLGFRIFELDTGVFVSSPLDQVGKSVRVGSGERRRLRCEGDVVEDRVRARHA